MLSMYQQITIKTLAKQNKKQTEIASEMGCHRNTVHNILKREKVIEKATRDKQSYFDQYREQIKAWLDKKVTHRRIFELLGESCTLERSYDSLCKYIQHEFPKSKEAYGVQISLPGEVAEVDFCYGGLLPVNQPGEPKRLAKTYFISIRLNYSRQAYREITHDQKVSTFIRAIDNAFISFKGVPKRLKIDNLRSAVIKNQHYDLQFQSDFLDYMSHVGVIISPCTPYHPEQKGGVESDMKYIENNFLVERSFQDFPDLNTQFISWSNNYANKRIHGITKKVPNEVFINEEQTALHPLPATPYAIYNRLERKVASNCHIFFNNHYYSVPAKLVGSVVTIRYSDAVLKVIADGSEVCCHPISHEIGAYTTVRSHLPEFKHYSQTEYQQRYEDKMADIGEAAHAYFRNILMTRDNYWYRSVRTILGLANEYGNEAVNLSLSRASEYRVTDTKIIRRIVEQQLYLLDNAPKLLAINNAPSPSHSQLPIVRQSTFLTRVIAGVKATISPSFPPSLSSPSSNITLERDLTYYQQLLGGEA